MMTTLHLMCGKIAAGKSTLAAELSQQAGTVLIAEDAWLHALFGDQMGSAQDYVRCSKRLRQIMQPHVEALLNTGVSVVLDFPANTVETRVWLRELVATTRVAHRLHLLEVSDEVCLERLRMRNVSGQHPFRVTEAQFHNISMHFMPPTDEEGFNVVLHRSG